MMVEKQTPKTPPKKSPLRMLMQMLSRLMPAGEGEENTQAVQMMYRLDIMKDLLKVGPLRRFWQQKDGKSVWPVTSGTYILGDPSAAVAVCALTSAELMDPLTHL